jgi:hypothetical protein
MSRPHEDLQRHTLADHHTGGPAIALAPASWWAIAVMHAAKERALAAVASYETLIEKARVSAPKAREAAVFESHDRRRVIALLHLPGHEAFAQLVAAWDEHHLVAQRHAIAESRSLSLYRHATSAGEDVIDPASTDAFAFERVSLGLERTGGVTAPSLSAPGFRGLTLFEEDGGASAVLYRFALLEDIEAFRATSEVQRALGSAGAPGETFYPVRAVRTFA